MKKIVLSTVGSMLFALCAVQAQEYDTAGTASKSRTKQQKHEQSTQQSDRSGMDKDQAWQQQSDGSGPYSRNGMVIVEKDQIPSALMQTLEDEKYAGWENATIYHNTNTGEYVIVPQPYRFDNQGKEIEMDEAQRHAWSQGRTSRYSTGDRGGEYTDRAGQPGSETPAQQQMGEIPTTATQDQSRSNDQPAQQPSTGYRSGDDTRNEASTQEKSGSGHQFDHQNMTEVQVERVPASLRRTLREREYKGWEDSGTLYQDSSSGEYVLVMDVTDNTSSSRTYRFDKNGRLKEDNTNK